MKKNTFLFFALVIISIGIYVLFFYEKDSSHYKNYESICDKQPNHLMCTVLKNYDAKKNCDNQACSVIKVKDDHGDSYINYGEVNDNYFVFAGYMWRIIRLNGNGSLRLIYSGVYNENKNYAKESSIIGYSSFNQKSDNTSIGYMYGIDDDIVKSFNIYAKKMNKTDKLVVAKNYTVDQKIFTLENGEEISIEDMYNDKLSYITKYFMVDQEQVMQISDILFENKEYTLKYYLITKGASSPSQAQQNDNDSEIKKYLDDWYDNHLKDYEQYLSDGIFCNDRSINESASEKYSNRAYAFETTLYYKDQYENLKCSNINNSFTLNDREFGNHALKNKIGLLSVAEALFSGIDKSDHHYLSSGIEYFTMSPYEYRNLTGKMMTINKNGKLDNKASKSSLGVRPVINLKLSNTVTSGDGTLDNPYLMN